MAVADTWTRRDGTRIRPARMASGTFDPTETQGDLHTCIMTTTNEDIITAKGYDGQVSFDGRTVTITRNGFVARTTHGHSTKTLPLSQIAGVQLRRTSIVSFGSIEFTVPGGRENNSRLGRQSKDASKNENAVQFTQKTQPQFEALHAAITEAL